MLNVDGLIGDVLFWSLARCVGQELYTDEVHQAFIKIMSRMLRTMVPLAVAFELRDDSAQSKRIGKHLESMSLSTMATMGTV